MLRPDPFIFTPMEDILKFEKRAGELGAKYYVIFRDIEIGQLFITICELISRYIKIAEINIF